MKCKIDGCDKGAMYAQQAVCQKHYFRFMRNGTYEMVRKPRAQLRRTNPRGYMTVYDPAHPLAMADGFVYEHRAIVYAKYGENLPDCEICGAATDWATCHIDHRDDSTANNVADNLRPLCRGCNTGRTGRKTIPRFEYRGEMKTLTELAALPGVQVTRHRALQRIREGQPIEQALFGRNKTHPRPSTGQS